MKTQKTFRTRMARLVLGTTVAAVAAISFAGAASASTPKLNEGFVKGKIIDVEPRAAANEVVLATNSTDAAGGAGISYDRLIVTGDVSLAK
jgi:hypothetical protein